MPKTPLSDDLLTLEDKLAFRHLQERGFLKINIHVSPYRARSLVLQGVALYDGQNGIAESLTGFGKHARANTRSHL